MSLRYSADFRRFRLIKESVSKPFERKAFVLWQMSKKDFYLLVFQMIFEDFRKLPKNTCCPLSKRLFEIIKLGGEVNTWSLLANDVIFNVCDTSVCVNCCYVIRCRRRRCLSEVCVDGLLLQRKVNPELEVDLKPGFRNKRLMEDRARSRRQREELHRRLAEDHAARMQMRRLEEELYIKTPGESVCLKSISIFTSFPLSSRRFFLRVF